MEVFSQLVAIHAPLAGGDAGQECDVYKAHVT